MELLSQFILSPYRTYKVSKKTMRGIATFSAKPANDYLDYSIDFSRRFNENERILSGGVCVYGNGLSIETVVPNAQYLTAFISGGNNRSTYYLTFTAQTNLGNVFVQEMVLPTFGTLKEDKKEYQYYSLSHNTKPPDTNPPLNAIKIDDRYLLNDSGFFMVI